VDDVLLKALADGRFHSGEELGAALGLSRAAIWKRLQALEALGLDVQSVRGKGYRVAGGLEFLDETTLREGMGEARALPLVLAMTTGSTNEDALARVRGGDRGPFAVLAEHQQGGRGRRGRSWVSPLGRNIYLSLAWPFDTGASGLEGLSLATGIAVAEALSEFGLDGRVQLKWPNDIWVSGRKVGGILTELAGDMDSACVAIIGVGINGSLPDRLGEDIDQPWTDLARETGQAVPRNALTASLLARLATTCETFAEQGFSAFHSCWATYDALAGQAVTLSSGASTCRGTCEGVSDRGALLLATEDGVRAFHGGEASLRPDGERD
jgi:BirA family biotin operon repressor/biotin-[acetyl-CoA-carboxylase] ligase